MFGGLHVVSWCERQFMAKSGAAQAKSLSVL